MRFPKPYQLVIWLLLISNSVLAADKLPGVDKAVEFLSDKSDRFGIHYDQLGIALAKLDSATISDYVDELEQKGKFANAYFKARFTCLNTNLKIRLHKYKTLDELVAQNETALAYAYETRDDYLIAFIAFQCGTHMLELRQMEMTATYLLQSQEIYEKIDPPVEYGLSHWIVMGEVLFHCQEYSKSIFYSRKGVAACTPKDPANILTRLYNTIAQGFGKLEQWDSAIYYYERSMKQANTDVWKGINAGYLGEYYFNQKDYQKAKPLLQYNYSVNRTAETDHAAKSLQILAAIDLAEHKNDSALAKIRESLWLIRKSASGYYLQQLAFMEHIYFTASDVHRAIGNTDSFYVYNNLYSQLHDSLQRVSLLTSTKIARLRIDNDNNMRSIQLLQSEKQAADLKRNFVILVVVSIAVILLLYLNGVRVKQKHRQEVALQQKNAAEAELNSAKQQLQFFTQNIVEKSALIEQLNHQLSTRELTAEQQQLITELTHQSILTEQDWEHFKSIFERIYPGFFTNLRQKAKDITIAEQRMAALTKLNISARHMASMLGISVDSVHKTRQRLRHRLQVPAEMNLEESVASF